MLESFVNIHVRSGDLNRVVQSAAKLTHGMSFISPPLNGWITIYDEMVEKEDDLAIEDYARELSNDLQTHMFVFRVVRNQLFIYYLFENGAVIDEFVQNTFFASENDDGAQQLRGTPALIRQYCPIERSLEEVQSALGWAEPTGDGQFATGTLGEERLGRVAELLRIDKARSRIGFHDFLSVREGLSGSDQFIQLGNSSTLRRRPVLNKGRIPPKIPPR